MKSYAALSLSLVLGLGCSPDASTSGATSGGGGDTGSGGSSSAETTAPSSATSTGPGVVVASSSGAGGDASSAGGGDTTSAGGGDQGSGGEDASGSSGGGDAQGGGGSAPSDLDVDDDGDTFTENEGDCRDDNPNVHPDATEVCNIVIDDNCNGAIDEGFDVDNDTYTSCNGDCDDGNASVNPDAAEVDNDVDDDCNGGVDEPWTDGDGDGYTPVGGDCNDDEILVNPGAIEFVGNDVDDDCDGTVDEALAPCDGGALDSNNPLDYARAIGLCNGEVVSATFVSGPAVSRGIRSTFGSNGETLNQPAEGARLVSLSSGSADTSTKDAGTAFDGNPSFGMSCTQHPHPNPLGDPGACGAADPTDVCDKTEISMQVRVPTNAQSFSYQFQFFSAEYQVFRCSAFDDTFLAMLSSQALNAGASTNISFDSLGRVVSVNTGFFENCNDNDNGGVLNDCTDGPTPTLSGTGYADSAAATNPLTTTSPVVPGEVITIRFIVFDEADDRLDSSVTIDDWRWSLDPADGPITDPT